MPEYHFGPVAVAAHQSRARLKYVWGSIGTAKSTWLVWRVFFKAVQASKLGVSLRAVIMRDTYRNLSDSTLKTWLRWFPDNSMMGYISKSNPADYMLRTPDGRMHEVLFRHGQTAQDASMFLSTEYGFIGLEEVAPAYLPGVEQRVSPGISEEVFDLAYSRLRQEGLEQPEIALTSNPPSRSHWASKRIIDKSGDERHGTMVFNLPGIAPVTWEHWFTPTSENQANLRPGYYEELTATWPRILVRRFVEGERVDMFIGTPRFNLDQLDDLKKLATVPSFQGLLPSTDENLLHVKLEEKAGGYVRMWAPPDLSKRYVIGADVAEGVEGGDYSAAYVLDCADASIVAAWHGHMEPALFSEELTKLGNLYNRANVCVENNAGGHGNLVLHKLSRDLGYPHIYTHQPADIRNPQQNRLGMRTDQRTKPMLVNLVGEYLESLGSKGEHGSINDKDLIAELQTFGIMENGRCEAQDGCFDDRVIAFSLALLVQQRSGLNRIFPSAGVQHAF